MAHLAAVLMIVDQMNPELAWQTEEHSQQFGKAIRANNRYLFNLRFQRYLPSRCLNYLLSTSMEETPSVLDIGCAAGDMYAYLTCLPNFNRVAYEGLDISKTAIEKANDYFSTDVFRLINGDHDLKGKQADIVVSVDIVPHQLRPFEHICNILNCSKKHLIIALRTRDEGETVVDPNLSCQRNYGEWVPWIVINRTELYRSIMDLSSSPVKITSFKEYTIFGGEGRRFLPKELYLHESKTAVTTLLMEKREDLSVSEITEYTYERMPAISYKKGLLYSYIGAGARKLGLDEYLARRSTEKVRSIGDILRHSRILDIQKVDLD